MNENQKWTIGIIIGLLVLIICCCISMIAAPALLSVVSYNTARTTTDGLSNNYQLKDDYPEWEDHDQSQSYQWTLQYAVELDLDLNQFKADLANPDIIQKVDEDVTYAKDLGVQGTPSHTFNGNLVSSATPDYETFYSDHIKDELNKGAKSVVIEVFTDLECPFCKREYPTHQLIEQKYKDQVEIVIRHYPLSFHKHAYTAAVAAEAAKRQDKFYEFIELVYANQEDLENPDF